MAALAGCAGTHAASNDTTEDFDGWLSDTASYDGVHDHTGQSTVTVAVGGADGRSFEPAAVRVDAGTTVRWEWTGGGSAHDVTAEDGGFQSDYHTEAGATFEHTFDASGTTRYFCVPHEYAGMKGVVVVE
ncbi:MAG: halocyanin domain-containing protein [Haloarculaceae archaeon]